MKKQTETVVVTGTVRFAYCNVFKARLNEAKGKEEYSVTLLIPKVANDWMTDPVAEIKDLRAIVKAVAESKFPGVTAKADGEPKWKSCIKDGDKETNSNGDPRHPGYFYIQATGSTEYPPKIVGPAKEALTQSSGWDSGDWGKVVISFYAWEFAGKKGVSAGLRALQFLHQDTHFKADPTDAFDKESSATTTDDYDPLADE